MIEEGPTTESPPANRARLRDQSFSLLRYSAFTYGVRLFSSIIVARLLGPEVMGLWLLLSLFPSWAEAFARLKVDLSAVYMIGQKRMTFEEAAGAIHVIGLITGGGAMLALLVAEPWILPRFFDAGTINPWAYRLVLLTIPLHFIAMNFAYLMLQREDVQGYNESNFLRGVTPSIVASGLLILTDLRIGALVVSLLGGTSIAVAYGAARLRHWKPAWPRDSRVWKELFTHSRGMYGAGLVEQFNQYISSVLLGLYLRPVDLTYFRLGQDRLQLLDQVPTALTTILYPRIANSSNHRERVSLVSMSCRVLIILLVPIAVVGGLLTPGIIWLLYGSQFMPASRSIWWLLPGVVALGITQPVVQFFYGAGRSDLSWRLPLAPLAVQLALIIPAMHRWGFEGAAAVLSLAFVVHGMLRVIVFSRLSGQGIADSLVVQRGDVDTVRAFVIQLVSRFRMPLRRPRPQGGTGS